LALDPRIGSGDMNNVGLQTRIDDKFDKKWFLESQKGAWSELETEVRNSFTERRRIEKEPLIRRTIAYCVNLSKAMISVPELVDKKNNGLLDSFIQQREIDMLLANIFGESILELRKKQNKKDKDELFKWNLLGKKVLQYNLLSMIHKEIEEFTDEEKTKIEKSIIKIFHDMKTGKGNKDIPQVLLDVVDLAYNRFMLSFDYHRETYYPEVTIKIIEDNVEREELQKVSPTHRQIELVLKGDGDTNVKGNLDPKILDRLIKTAKNLDERFKKPNLLKDALKKFLPETVGDESDENETDEEKDDSSSESKEDDT